MQEEEGEKLSWNDGIELQTTAVNDAALIISKKHDSRKQVK